MDTRLSSIKFHDCLHGFLSGRGTGTATTEVKLTQQLAYLEQAPLYGIFIDLKKAYDAMDRERCMEIMRGYGVGPNILRLIQFFWDNAELVCRASGVFGRPFKARRGVPQGGPVSPRIFNIMVDAIVREWLRQVLGDKAAIEGIGEEVWRFLAAFYADDGLIQSRDPVLLQSSFNILIALFDRVGLKTNTTKTKAMVCVPGKIRLPLSTEVYNNCREGLTSRSDWQRRRVQCETCGVYMSATSLQAHMECKHGVYKSFLLNRELPIDAPPTTYRAYLSQPSNRLYCPVPGCTGSLANENNLRMHFARRHPESLVRTPKDGCPSKCEHCGLQVTLRQRLCGHEETAMCQDLEARKEQHRAAVVSATALQQELTAYEALLERVEVFKYLSQLIAFDDNDVQAM